MKVMLALFCFWCLDFSHGYIFPICRDSDDDTCSNYFTLPSFPFSLSATKEESHFEMMKNTPQTIVEVFSQTFDKIVTPLTDCYNENVAPIVDPVLAKTYQTILQNLPTFSSNEYMTIVPYFPFLKEKKAKADSRLYLLFIGTSVTIYLALYVYFTKKLYFYYQNNLRRQYLDSVHKIFKQRD